MANMLLVMRLKDMRRVHPQQDNSRRCSRCQHRVGIYPSGQAVLEQDPTIEIICQVCAAEGPAPDIIVNAPGALDEPAQSRPKDE